jgi:CBS domain-containing protein
MKSSVDAKARPSMVLCAETAQELMTPNPVSISADAAVGEAVAFLIDKGYSGAPVIDEAGRPIGVLSRTDILVHDRAKTCVPDYYNRPDVKERLPAGFQVENVDRTPVRDLMTPVVFSVRPDATAARVVTDMLDLRVHRLFVVSENSVLVGVISALDILKHLRPASLAD